jgi:hypothetical protein
LATATFDLACPVVKQSLPVVTCQILISDEKMHILGLQYTSTPSKSPKTFIDFFRLVGFLLTFFGLFDGDLTHGHYAVHYLVQYIYIFALKRPCLCPLVIWILWGGFYMMKLHYNHDERSLKNRVWSSTNITSLMRLPGFF